MDPNKEKKLLTELKLAREKIKLFQRDAEIEAALDRVRACSMAMHYSSELIEVVRVLDQAIKGLGIQNIDATQIITDFTDPDKGLNVWIAVENMNYLEKFHIPVLDHPALSNHFKAVREKINFYTEKYPKAESARLFKLLFKYSDFKSIPEYRKEVLLNSPGLVRSVVIHNNSALIFQHNGLDEFSEEANAIFKRFGVVFEQAYTRFIDLQKAEEQAREAQIEAALERVRSVSMAMKESDELIEVATIVYQELIELGFDSVVSGGFNFPDAENNITQCWFAEATEENFLQDFKIPFGGDSVLNERHEYREKGIPFLEQVLSREEVEKHMEFVFPTEGSSDEELAARKAMPDPTIFSIQFLNEGYMILISVTPLSDEQKSMMRRFAGVFNSAYTRFLDLQKAEEQAREAQIEAALERVRSRSMAMQSSDELSDVVHVMYNEVEKLEISNWGIALMIFDDKNKNIQMWFSEHFNNKHVRPYDFGNLNHELVRKWWEFWNSEDEFLTVHLKDEDNEKWTNYLFEDTGMKNLPKDVKEAIRSDNEVYFIYSKMKQGLVSFINLQPFSEEIYPILKRITRTFEQAYTRFLDVQRAEKLALETARQSSLDRIRAEIASMRNAEDLDQITPLIWNELKTLEIPFIRCGVFIIDEENGISHTYLSTSRGEPIAALNLPLTEFPLLKNSMKSWKNREIYTVHWDEQDFRDWSQSLIDGGFIQSKKKYSAGSVPETLDLHFLPFKHGMLYIGNTEPLSEKELDLGQSLASAFSVAYDRYEDFNKLEKAFRELEEAKDQLVQQEKLASLGQLTAGIAHEIKNPLNFVNNFSDLSIELLDEAREEVKELLTTDNSQLTAILNDVEANLKKIHEHGIRADRIVKSMLQHSRGGSGKMEPTDLNALIKEYVNLAFHGMRAGKDPIDVDVQLQLDENVGEVSLIAEDFSRVILNLCNNAFDAKREKLSENAKGKSEKPPFEEPVPTPREGADPSADGEVGDVAASSYQPKLTIRTVRNRDTVTIDVQDNGSGIPEEIKDKILQPFFTTKKGTAGTGLGLSITNDIIKAHGGSLNIQSDSNGSTFIVSMPL